MARPCVNDRGEPIECAKVNPDGTRTMKRDCQCWWDVFELACLCEEASRPSSAQDERDRQGLGRVYAALYGGAVYSTETPEGRERIAAELGAAPPTEPKQEPASWAALPPVSMCGCPPGACGCRYGQSLPSAQGQRGRRRR